MTFTTVHKDYEAASFEAAAAAMLRDDVVWNRADAIDVSGGTRGLNKGYSVYEWEWTPSVHGGTLRVRFR